MLNAIYIGLVGMTAYSKGLNVIGNNVANLNTPGFKSGDPLFSNLVFTGAQQHGAGVTVDTERLSFKQGDMSDAGDPLDAAIDGTGFFVLAKDNERTFTRAGQFEFDDDGNLIHTASHAKVMVNTPSALAAAFNIEEFRVSQPKATTEVSLTGNLARTGEASYTLPNITVRDTAGDEHILSATFVRDSGDPLSWTAEVHDADNAVLGSAKFVFAADGTPVEPPAISVTVQPKDLPAFTFVVKLGDAGRFNGVTSVPDSAQSLLQVRKSDGLTLGHLTDVSFDTAGRMQLKYSNGDSKSPATLVLARFSSSTELKDIGDGLYTARDASQAVLATASDAGVGNIVGGRIERSNVDLTSQFTDLIVVQRGYQASSQLASVANEMIQQLLAIGERRG